MTKYHRWFLSSVHVRALATLLALSAIAGCGGSDATADEAAPDSPGLASSVGAGSRPTGDAGTAMPAGDAGTAAPSTQTPATPAAETPAAETPAAETPAAETPAAETPATETPATPTPATPTPAPAPAASGAPYPLPTLPAEVAGIRWPTAPAITRTVTARTIDEANAAAATAGTRVHVEGALAGAITIRANDVEVEFAPGASAGSVMFGKALARVAVRGGTVDHIETELPAVFEGGALQFRRELLTTDIMVDGVTANAADTAFLMRAGVRVAVVNSTGTAARYTLWFGDTGDFNSEDVIIAGNDFSSAGPEATLRLVHVVRSVTVDNRLQNGAKHNYRTHGRAENNYASGNLLVNSGIMLGTMDTDFIGRQWFVGNTLHHTTPSLLEIHLDTPDVTISDNTIYTNVWDCLLCRDLPAGWVMENNQLLPYQPAPAR